jgi:hypothetical protein
VKVFRKMFHSFCSNFEAIALPKGLLALNSAWAQEKESTSRLADVRIIG